MRACSMRPWPFGGDGSRTCRKKKRSLLAWYVFKIGEIGIFWREYQFTVKTIHRIYIRTDHCAAGARFSCLLTFDRFSTMRDHVEVVNMGDNDGSSHSEIGTTRINVQPCAVRSSSF